MTTRDETTTTTRRGHDRRLVALMVVTIAILYAETWLRLQGLLPSFELDVVGLPIGAAEVIFGGGVTLGLGGTLALAFTAPSPAADDTVGEDVRETRRERSGRPRSRSVGGPALADR